MDFYAWASILEVLLKLAVVFLLVMDGGDKLIRYGVLTFLVTVVITLLFVFYCRTRFEECVFRLRYNRKDSAEILGFAGWQFVSSMGDVALDQGVNIVLPIALRTRWLLSWETSRWRPLPRLRSCMLLGRNRRCNG